jgi:hypothetical protein
VKIIFYLPALKNGACNIFTMNQEILNIINKKFNESDRETVIEELSSLQLSDVMANSQINLDNTLKAILKLSFGEIQKVIFYTNCAKTDFRDVIMWASESHD